MLIRAFFTLLLAPFSMLLWMLATSLTGCNADPRHYADQLAQRGNLQHGTLWAAPFHLTTYTRITRADRPLHVYIEGDGRAWIQHFRVSRDPTPRRAMGLALAAEDTAANVVYLARPCQFTVAEQASACRPEYWTGKRFAHDVVASMDAAISHYLRQTPGQPVVLTGYSGGGAIAVLIAARRKDIALLRTVAGNLNHVAVNRLHRVALMPDSLNPADVANEIAAVPQLHFSGDSDRIVPSVIAHFFVTAVGRCADVREVHDMDHEGDWPALWSALLQMRVPCEDPAQRALLRS
ncbi:alpha/beta hydrolase [Candidatus Symbiopectobacterium sp. NZEC135]|uniref:alpha/beta hydrolase n=1 Tax=Candidatus Symbiopectobacterium sp. NZEC135 TaxID=2820471 RepID=UPI00222761EF|nr:alpha/beta hydrolase [Candidatus Symbiopectobacterium sp. NZEC135]MCW2477515.1 alpha/beta hydrolase [Candidatus Symbiopectobacterium sp. NZEC135]